MKILEKDFNKLKQLDRIEYRQKILLNEIFYKYAIILAVLLGLSSFLPIIFSVLLFFGFVFVSVKWWTNISKIEKQYFSCKMEVKK
jgi:hypothetical protein